LSIPKAVEVINPHGFDESGISSLIVDEANQYFAFDHCLLLNHMQIHLVLPFSFPAMMEIPSTVKTLSDSLLLIAILHSNDGTFSSSRARDNVAEFERKNIL
jgi:hypothetical protein